MPTTKDKNKNYRRLKIKITIKDLRWVARMKITNLISKQVWEDRYSKDGESLEQNLDRVAKFCSAGNDSDYKDFKDVLEEALFFPGGRAMSNAGIGRDLTLNNCFVAPQIGDNMNDIFSKVKLGALTHQKGGGIGYDFSRIRPRGTPTSNDATASGPVSFIDVFNTQTGTITQGGRRGANMGVLNIYALDIDEFITAKAQDASRLKFFNLSVMVDADFMKAKDNNQDIYLHFPVYDVDGNIEKDESKWKFKKKVNAKELWDKIMKNAYNNGEPGIFFYENMNDDNNLWYIEKIVCSNPCAEYLAGTVYGNHPITGEKLKPEDFGGSCNLGSLVLHNFVKEPFTKRAEIDYEKLKIAITTGVRLLDNIIDINNYPDEIYKNYQTSFRTIGLGVMGLADMLVMLNIKYGSEEAIKFIDELMNYIVKNVYKASIELAKEKGPFPLLDREKYIKSGFIKKHVEKDPEWKEIEESILKYGIRNAKMVSIAPNGTISLTFGNNCSSGLEPIFSLSYERKVKIGGQDDSNIQIVQMEDHAYSLWKNLKKDNIVTNDVFVTALELPVSAHLEMLKAINFHVDMSSSKTINIPTSYPFEDTKEVYDYCFENGIKGCTIFRPNEIRQGILISEPSKPQEEQGYVNKDQLQRGYILSTDDNLIGRKRKLITGCGSLHVTAFFDPIDGEFQELFLSKGSDGGCNNYMNGLSRMTSLAARAGVDIYSIVDQLKSCGVCPSYAVRKATKGDASFGSCCPVAVGNCLLELYKEVQNELLYYEEDEQMLEEYDLEEECEECEDGTKVAIEKIALEEAAATIAEIKMQICPECGEETLAFEGGCNTCKSCGYSKCG